MRGILLDRGIAFGKSASRAKRQIPQLLADPNNGLTTMAREILQSLFEFLLLVEARIKDFDKRIDRVFRASPLCQRIATVPGVGPKTATAIVAAVGDGHDFKNGRHMAAWLGLVPRHRASGDRIIMGPISKHGDQHLRTLLVHGARAVMRGCSRKNDPMNRWLAALVERRGANRAIVAMANKNARIIWSLLAKETEYMQPA